VQFTVDFDVLVPDYVRGIDSSRHLSPCGFSSSPEIWQTDISAVLDRVTRLAMQGKNFVKKGALYYDYKTQRARADYYDWCIPLFDGTSGGGPNLYNETCSFLMTPKGAFFIRFAKLITHDTHGTHDTRYTCCHDARSSLMQRAQPHVPDQGGQMLLLCRHSSAHSRLAEEHALQHH
jgi:hypothetical protein